MKKVDDFKKKWRRKAAETALLLSLGCAHILCGCSFFSPAVEVDLRFPQGPWERLGLPVYHVLRYPEGGGPSDIATRTIPAGIHRVSLRLPRGGFVPVAAYPLGRLKPFGAILGPETLGGGSFGAVKLDLSPEMGALAELFLENWGSRERFRSVNFSALQVELTEKGGGNPWTCDLERIELSILLGKLNRLQVRQLPEAECEIEVPAGEWISETILALSEIEAPPPDGSLTRFTGLFQGCQRFYNPQSAVELHLYVDKERDCRWILGSLSDFPSRF